MLKLNRMPLVQEVRRIYSREITDHVPNKLTKQDLTPVLANLKKEYDSTKGDTNKMNEISREISLVEA